MDTAAALCLAAAVGALLNAAKMAVLDSAASGRGADNERIVQDALSVFEQRPPQDRNSFMCVRPCLSNCASALVASVGTKGRAERAAGYRLQLDAQRLSALSGMH